MNCIEGDGEVGNEVGVVSSHGMLDDDVDGVVCGIVEEETNEDDKERVEDVVGKIHILRIDTYFVFLSMRGKKNNTRDWRVDECNFDSAAE